MNHGIYFNFVSKIHYQGDTQLNGVFQLSAILRSNKAIALMCNNIVDWETKVTQKQSMRRINAYLYNCGPQQCVGGTIAVLVVMNNMERVCLSHVTRRMRRFSVICVLHRLRKGVRQANTLMHCQSLFFSELTSFTPYPALIPEYTFFLSSLPFLDYFWHFSSSSPLFFSSNISLLLLFSC